MRFVNNCHVNAEYRTKGEITLDEIKDAEKQITQKVQYEAFHYEYVALQKGKLLPINNRLLGLCPRLDKDGLMRSDS